MISEIGDCEIQIRTKPDVRCGSFSTDPAVFPAGPCLLRPENGLAGLPDVLGPSDKAGQRARPFQIKIRYDQSILSAS